MTGDRIDEPQFNDNVDRDSDPFQNAGASAAGPADAEIIARLVRGNEAAMRLLMDRYDRLIRYTIFRAGGGRCQRDPNWLDARANETWAGIVQSLRRAGSRGLPPNLAAYFIQIARHKCHDAISRMHDRGIISFEAALESPSASPETLDTSSDPADILDNLECIDALHSCIEHLNEDDKILYSENVLILDRKWTEAARRLGLPESTVRSRWTALLAKLRRCVEKKIQKDSRPGG